MRLVLLWVTRGRVNQKPSINLWTKHQTYIFSKKSDICLKMHFSNIFDKFGRIRFLYQVVISPCLRISGNIGNFMELLKLLQRKLLKISVFSFTKFIRKLVLCDALFTCSFKIYFSVCFWPTSTKLKQFLFLHLF